MFEVNVTAHGKDITFTVVAWGVHVDGIIEITTKCEEC